MIKKKLIKKSITLLMIIIIFLINSNVYAMSIKVALQDPTTNPSYWEPSIVSQPELTDKAGIVLGIISTIGVILSVIILAIVGIKYILGSVEEKADYKKDMIPYIVGASFLAFATTIPNIIYNFVQDAIK